VAVQGRIITIFLAISPPNFDEAASYHADGCWQHAKRYKTADERPAKTRLARLQSNISLHVENQLVATVNGQRKSSIFA
jgi:hypothetical protein